MRAKANSVFATWPAAWCRGRTEAASLTQAVRYHLAQAVRYHRYGGGQRGGAAQDQFAASVIAPLPEYLACFG